MKILVIGSGLAGISIAERMLEMNIDVHILSDTQRPSSTRIATGMYNPVVFRRLNLSWMIDDLLPVMHDLYSALEKKLGIALNEPIRFAKKIPSEDYATLWQKRQPDEPHVRYMDPIHDGYGPVKQAGMIDCTELQRAYQDWLRTNGRLIDRNFSYDELALTDHGVKIEEGEFDTVIFCDGPYAVENPYFNWLPFNLCQGEWIIIETESPLPIDQVVNNKTNVIPLGGNRYKLSSTYSWKTLDWQPHEEAKQELIKNYEKLFQVPYTVVEHEAAQRPTVADRRPYLGRHPKHKQLAIFNGLGSKGVMLTPYFSKHLVEHLLEGKELMEEVDILRHGKRFGGV